MTDQERFIESIGPAAVRASAGTSIFPSVKIAQAAIETGYGKYSKGNNLFGIKARGEHSPFWRGREFYSATKEWDGSQYVTIEEPFRAYDSVADSIRDHTWFLVKNQRYRNAGVFDASTPREQALALSRAGYATDPGYADKISYVIGRYNLERFDRKKLDRERGRILVGVAVVVALVVLLWICRKHWLKG